MLGSNMKTHTEISEMNPKIKTTWANHCPRCDKVEERDYGPGRYPTPDRCGECNSPFNVVDPEILEVAQ